MTAASSDSETVGSAFVRLKLDLEETKVQGVFFYWSALKMTKCQTLRKF